MAFGIVENGQVIARFAAPITITSNQPVVISDTLSLKRQVSSKAAQRWEIEANLEPLSKNAGVLYSYLITKGYGGTVEASMPQPFDQKDLAGAQFTASSAALGASVITASGLTSSVPRGTFVRFADDPKVYMITSSSTNTCTVYPPLVKNNTGKLLYINNFIVGQFYLDTSSIRGLSYIDGVLMDVGSIKLVEKL
jgi:hypothetical protein